MNMQRLWDKINKTSGCWVWTGAGLTSRGYGLFWKDGKVQSAHRVVYELLVGEIPEGLTLDHLCRNRACVNPQHLEPVTQKVNTLRGESLSAKYAQRTHCKNGHEYTTENTSLQYGWRRCNECNRINAKASYYRKLSQT